MKIQTPLNALNPNGYLRLKDVLRLYPVSKSTWWLGVQQGRFPQPVKLSIRISAWRVSDIQDLLATPQGNKSLYAQDSAWQDSTSDGLIKNKNN